MKLMGCHYLILSSFVGVRLHLSRLRVNKGRVFGSRILGRMFGPERKELTSG
jgi:hypothetical protein